MKHFYIGLAIFAGLLAVSIAASVYLCRCTDESAAWLSAAETALAESDLARAAECAEAARSAFERCKKPLRVLLSHDETDAIDIAFSEIGVYGAEGNREEFHVRCAELQLRLRDIAAIDLPLYYNFL